VQRLARLEVRAPAVPLTSASTRGLSPGTAPLATAAK